MSSPMPRMVLQAVSPARVTAAAKAQKVFLMAGEYLPVFIADVQPRRNRVIPQPRRVR